MSTEYKLSYTASEIDEKLGKIDELQEQLDNVIENGSGSGGVSSWNDLTDKPFYDESSTEVLLEELTFASVEAEEGSGMYIHQINNVAFQPVVGESYRVVWYEEEYICEAQDGTAATGSGVFLGNCTGLGLSGNSEPFIIGFMDGMLAIMCLTDTVSTEHTVAIYQDTTVIKTLDKKFLPIPYFGEVTTETDILSLGRFEDFTLDAELGAYGYLIAGSYHLTVGEYYKVSWDGVEYTCEALDVSQLFDDVEAVALGNGTMFGYTGNNEPFVICCVNTIGSLILACLTHTEQPCEHHDVRVYAESTIIKKIDSKYLPESADRSSLPEVTTSDAGKFLRVSTDGTWIAESIPNAEGASF